MKKRVIFLMVLGCLQMFGDLTGLKALKVLGLATNASPAPKVFCSAQGLETFSSEFVVIYEGDAGIQHLPLTPYLRMQGPYNRRNVYGAVLAYGPILPEDLRDPVLHYGLGPQGALLKELGIRGARNVSVRVLPKVAPEDMKMELVVRKP